MRGVLRVIANAQGYRQKTEVLDGLFWAFFPPFLLLCLDGRSVRDPEDVADAVSDHEPGDRIEVVVERGGEERAIEVELGTRP